MARDEPLDDLDRALLGAVQDGFPVCREPYAELASACGTTPREAERRIARMRESGAIRRMGAVVDSRAVGMTTTLAGADVEPDAVDRVAAVLDGFGEVTHCYLRDGRPNVWFTLVAPSREAADARLAEVRDLGGVRSCEDFPATRVFKLGVRVDVAAGEGDGR